MIPCPTTWRRALVLAVAAVLLVAAPASAHPFFRGGEAPVDSLVTLTLAMAHGCGTEDEGGGDPTTEVAMEIPDWMRLVDVPEEEGFTIEVEEDDEGRALVVTWTADDPTEPAPDLDVDVVVSGDPGDERYVRVFQACDGFSYRWVGTPDEPADDPAVRLTLVDADPDSPPPPEPEPEPEPEPAEPDEADDTTALEEDEVDADATEEAATEEAATEEAATEDAAAEDAADEPATEAAAADRDEDGLSGAVVLVLALAAVAAIAAGAWLLRRRGAV